MCSTSWFNLVYGHTLAVLNISGDDSDESDDESALEVQPYLMDEGNSVEAALFELIHEYQLEVKVNTAV